MIEESGCFYFYKRSKVSKNKHLIKGDSEVLVAQQAKLEVDLIAEGRRADFYVHDNNIRLYGGLQSANIRELHSLYKLQS